MTVEITEPLNLISADHNFTECPRWRDGWLYFSDMYGKAVYRVDETGKQREVVCHVEKRPGGIGFLANGDMLVTEMDAGRVLRLHDGELSEYKDLSKAAPTGLNDMVVSPEGACYIARYTVTSPPPENTVLVLDADANQHETEAKLLVANGMILRKDARELIVAESAGARLSIFDIDEKGMPVNRRIFAELPAGHYPDGICGDADGGVWVTCCLGPGVIRVEEGGKITHRIPIGDGRFAYACALGGADGKTLYICTAGKHNAEGMAKKESRIEAVRVDHRQAGIP